MPQFVVERNIPGLGDMDKESLREISAKSNAVVASLGLTIVLSQTCTEIRRGSGTLTVASWLSGMWLP